MNLLADTHIMLEPLFVFYVFGFMFLLSFCQKFIVYLFLCLFILMQSVQLNFMAFFGHPITASEIMNIFYEKRDVIDHIVTNDSEPLFFSQHRDEGLALLLDKIDFSKGKKFVVLHLRTPHLPYEKHYQAHKDKFQKFLPDTPDADRLTYMVNSYDNALLYNDFVVDEIINTFEKHNQNRKYVIFFTADHGQLFNYHGMWGHNKLIVEQGKVPAFIFNYKEKLPPTISAYQFSKLILQALGGKLINPNEKDNVFYLHGNNIYYPMILWNIKFLKTEISHLNRR